MPMASLGVRLLLLDVGGHEVERASGLEPKNNCVVSKFNQKASKPVNLASIECVVQLDAQLLSIRL